VHPIAANATLITDDQMPNEYSQILEVIPDAVRAMM
jgi:hypothetical protein